ncbi:GNAT family N-acetyltransferase [Amycolatopsis rhabdoformis]|uniref:GNAT family N-acetyltransferase n=1 Tax=Amycolatopsis rhabdoformis TaxID=1448059 RepID=A0ABZ1IE75_9PSEU|nr:GNAT family N-acetyltransferase [Amycolatopsis rhabdoformis]WSE32051.1 GNAT family N-acetyltransferase [Amycolatopsis rhabdoformis]
MRTESLTWRPLTRGDAQASADLLNAMDAVDGIGELYTAEDTLQELIDPGADLERASLAVFAGDVMVGFMKIRYKRFAEETHRVLLDGGVHPDHRRRGLGTTLVEAGVAAAKTLHDLHHPTLKLAIDVYRAEGIAGLAELLRGRGFTPARYFQRMERSLAAVPAAPTIPDGLRLEPWSAGTDEDFLAARNEAFRDVWGAPALPLDFWRNKFTNHTLRPEASFLVRDTATGTPAGMLVTNHWPADAEVTGVRDAHVMALGTVPACRGRGVATALIAHALRAAAEHGFERMSLNVDSAGPAGTSGIFARAGFTPKTRYVRWALEA